LLQQKEQEDKIQQQLLQEQLAQQQQSGDNVDSQVGFGTHFGFCFSFP
jgi:hypothetical protein